MAHVRVGGKIFTTAAQLDEFFQAVAKSDTEYFASKPATPQPDFRKRTDTQRARDYDRAEAELKAAGF